MKMFKTLIVLIVSLQLFNSTMLSAQHVNTCECEDVEAEWIYGEVSSTCMNTECEDCCIDITLNLTSDNCKFDIVPLVTWTFTYGGEIVDVFTDREGSTITYCVPLGETRLLGWSARVLFVNVNPGIPDCSYEETFELPFNKEVTTFCNDVGPCCEKLVLEETCGEFDGDGACWTTRICVDKSGCTIPTEDVVYTFEKVRIIGNGVEWGKILNPGPDDCGIVIMKSIFGGSTEDVQVCIRLIGTYPNGLVCTGEEFCFPLTHRDTLCAPCCEEIPLVACKSLDEQGSDIWEIEVCPDDSNCDYSLHTEDFISVEIPSGSNVELVSINSNTTGDCVIIVIRALSGYNGEPVNITVKLISSRPDIFNCVRYNSIVISDETETCCCLDVDEITACGNYSPLGVTYEFDLCADISGCDPNTIYTMSVDAGSGSYTIIQYPTVTNPCAKIEVFQPIFGPFGANVCITLIATSPNGLVCSETRCYDLSQRTPWPCGFMFGDNDDSELLYRTNEIIIAPNPVTQGVMEVQVPSMFNDDVISISIIDISGNLVQEIRNVKHITSQNVQVSLNNNIQKGVYQLLISNGSIQKTVRFIVGDASNRHID